MLQQQQQQSQETNEDDEEEVVCVCFGTIDNPNAYLFQLTLSNIEEFSGKRAF